MLESSLSSLLNAYLKADTEAASGLDEIDQRTVRVYVRELKLTRYLKIDQRKVFIEEHSANVECDTAIEISLAAMRSFLAGQNVLDMVKEDRIAIDGDTHTVSVLQRVLRNVEIDWEEWLSQKVGDNLAYGISRVVQTGSGFAQRFGATLKESVRDYVIEEKKMVPSALEVEAFATAVDQLRADTDRLEARVRRMMQSHG